MAPVALGSGGFVVMLDLGGVCVVVLHYMPGNSNDRADEDHGADYVDAVENKHSIQGNRTQGTGRSSRIVGVGISR
jgi:hypothetical protein